MKRRLEIARGLLHRPAGLFLDEPTVGLDPRTRQNIWEHITALRREHGVTVFMTTHYMDEAEYFDRIGIMGHTYLIALDTPYSLITEGIAGRRSRATSFRRQPGDDSPAPSGIWRCSDRRSGYRPVSGRWGDEVAPRLLQDFPVRVFTIDITPPTLNDVLLDIPGRTIRDEAAGNAGRSMTTPRSPHR